MNTSAIYYDCSSSKMINHAKYTLAFPIIVFTQTRHNKTSIYFQIQIISILLGVGGFDATSVFYEYLISHTTDFLTYMLKKSKKLNILWPCVGLYTNLKFFQVQF